MHTDEDDELIPMADLGWHEPTLLALLPRWLPPDPRTRGPRPTGEQLLALARAPQQAALEQPEETVPP